jgi:hypothetical protein
LESQISGEKRRRKKSTNKIHIEYKKDGEKNSNPRLLKELLFLLSLVVARTLRKKIK